MPGSENAGSGAPIVRVGGCSDANAEPASNRASKAKVERM
jgi:hypothetical protein